VSPHSSSSCIPIAEVGTTCTVLLPALTNATRVPSALTATSTGSAPCTNGATAVGVPAASVIVIALSTMPWSLQPAS